MLEWSPLSLSLLLPTANKRKLFEKAQLKRQYAKLLKKEAAGEHGSPALVETERFESKSQAGREGEPAPSPLSTRRRKGWRGRRLNDVDKQEDGAREQPTEEAKDRLEKRRRPEHRPDPFKEAKVRLHGKYIATKRRFNSVARHRTVRSFLCCTKLAAARTS